MLPFLPNKDTFAVFERLDEPNISALARKLFDALSASLWPTASLAVIAGMWKGVRKSPGGSSASLIILGVELRVPHVIRCFTAAGPSSAGVGEGRLGISENPCFLGELG